MGVESRNKSQENSAQIIPDFNIVKGDPLGRFFLFLYNRSNKLLIDFTTKCESKMKQ